jgi:hypothetical protein
MSYIVIRCSPPSIFPTKMSIISGIMPHHERVWQCGSGCFSNNFSCRNACKWFFLFFKNHFWHQHIKTIQNVQIIVNYSKKKLNFVGTRFQLRSLTSSTCKYSSEAFWNNPVFLTPRNFEDLVKENKYILKCLHKNTKKTWRATG